MEKLKLVTTVLAGVAAYKGVAVEPVRTTPAVPAFEMKIDLRPGKDHVHYEGDGWVALTARHALSASTSESPSACSIEADMRLRNALARRYPTQRVTIALGDAAIAWTTTST